MAPQAGENRQQPARRGPASQGAGLSVGSPGPGSDICVPARKDGCLAGHTGRVWAGPLGCRDGGEGGRSEGTVSTTAAARARKRPILSERADAP